MNKWIMWTTALAVVVAGLLVWDVVDAVLETERLAEEAS